MAITKNLQNGSILLEDGTGTPQTLTIPVDEGDFTFTVRPREGIPIYNRGTLVSFTKGPQNAMTWSFSIKFREWGGRTVTTTDPITPVEFMTQTGDGSSLVSTTTCGPYTFDITYQIVVGCTDIVTDQDEDIKISDCRCDELTFSEGAEYSTISASGKSLSTAPTSTRSTASG